MPVPAAPVVVWFLKEGGGLAFGLVQSYLTTRMGFNSSQSTLAGTRSLLDEYIQRLERKLDEDRLAKLHGAFLQLKDAHKTQVVKQELLIQAISNFQMLAQYPEQGMTGGYTNAKLVSLAYVGMAAGYIALKDKPELIAEKMIQAIYADTNTAKEWLGEDIVRQTLTKYPKPASLPQQASAKSSSPSPKLPRPAEQATIAASMGTVLLAYNGHRGSVYAVAWSPDGAYIASAGEDKTVQIWEVATGKILRTFQGKNKIIAVAWSPDGTRIASAGEDKTVQIWEAATGKVLLTYYGHTQTVYTVFWSPDGTRIASGSSDGTVQIWNPATSQTIINSRNYPKLKNVTAIRGWSPDGKFMVSVGFPVNLWEVDTGRIIASFRHRAEVAKWSPDCNYIASGGNDKTVQVWNVTTGQSILKYQGHRDRVTGLAWSPDGKYIASASNDKTVQIWTALTGKLPLTHRPSDVKYAGRTLTWSPHSDRIALGSVSNWGTLAKSTIVIIRI